MEQHQSDLEQKFDAEYNNESNEIIPKLVQDQFLILPNEILIYLLGFVFLNSEIIINSEDVFEAVENIKVYIAITLKNISLTRKGFYILQSDLIKLKAELLQFYRSKLKSLLLVKSTTKEGLYEGDKIDWIPFDSYLNQKIGMFLLNDSAEDDRDHILPRVIEQRLNKEYTIQLIDLLLFFGLNVNSQDHWGRTGLTNATAYDENEDIVKYLLAKNPDIDIKDESGNTALIIACMFGCKRIVQILLDKNADVSILNETGESALDVARAYNKPEIAMLLENYIRVLFLKFYITMLYKERERKESIT